MGIFSEWRLFTDPEVLLEECIDANPFHPFQVPDTDDSNAQPAQGKQLSKLWKCLYLEHEIFSLKLRCYIIPMHPLIVYVYSCRFNRFYAALLMILLSLLFIIIWPAAGGDAVCTN
jgi:hypothetical protein